MIRLLAGLLLAAALAAAPARAQLFGDLEQDATGRPASIAALGMGNAAVALIDADYVFSYNPAQLGQLPLDRLRLAAFGVRFGFSPDVFDKTEFITGDLQDAVDAGLDDLYETDRARLEALYDQARALAQEESVLAAQVVLPQAFFRAGPVNVGVGAFVHGISRFQFSPDLIPVLDAYAQTELLVPVSVGYRVPGTALGADGAGGLAVGLTTRYIRRQVTAKQTPIDALDDTQSLYFFRGSGLAVDVGAHYEDVVEGLDLGLAVYNLVGGDVGLSYEGGRVPFDGSNAPGALELVFGVSEPTVTATSPEDLAEAARLEARFAERSGRPLVRVGAAYGLRFANPASAFTGATVSLDYASRSTSEFDQPFGAHLRLGAGVELVDLFHVRGGLSQGYPAFGLGLDTRFVQVDYAFFGVEDGRLPGQLKRSNHRFQLRFGLF